MRQIKHCLFAFALLTGTAAFGQVAEFTVHGGASRLSNTDMGSAAEGTSGYSLDSGFRIGFRITLNNWRYLGHEFGYGYNRSHLLLGGVDQGGMAIHQGFYDLLAYGTPEGSRIRPFVAGGVHFNNYTPPGASAGYGQGSTKFGINYGAGVKARVANNFEVRLDYRQYANGKPFGIPGNSGWTKMNEISVGFGLVL
ncbi:MAG: outer membrane beta-barrel protein [Bryobacterales bacterium]|nr:outer membrane beta-barrel protein [Bryobacterales bacterium]